MRPVIVFSDLDGTLLDHETYSFEAALPALSRLKNLYIPLVLASSKTAAEIAPLRAAMGFAHCPAIVENGAGVLPPDCGADDAGTTHERLVAALDALPAELRSCFTGFSDWDVSEIAATTGLDRSSAERARKRSFSEPGLWTGTEAQLEAFRSRLLQSGIIIQKGGRFHTLSFGGNKADRLGEISLQFESEKGSRPFCLALGDAPNDIAMLETADCGVIIPNPGHSGIPELAGEMNGRVKRARFPGPKGWNDSVLSCIDEIEKNGT
ncbi:HAD-IIB family hydrolase [Hoeflea sp. CAU 1731]